MFQSFTREIMRMVAAIDKRISTQESLIPVICAILLVFAFGVDVVAVCGPEWKNHSKNKSFITILNG